MHVWGGVKGQRHLADGDKNFVSQVVDHKVCAGLVYQTAALYVLCGKGHIMDNIMYKLRK